MRRALVALGAVAALVATATPAAACTLVLPPLRIGPAAGPVGTEISVGGWCDGAGSVTLDFTFPTQRMTWPIDSASVAGDFQTKLTNRYAPPLPPGASYRSEMEVTLRCNNGLVDRQPFFATDGAITTAGANVYTSLSDGPPTVRSFASDGAVYSNYYWKQDGRGASVAVMKPCEGCSGPSLVVGAGSDSTATFNWRAGVWDAYPLFRGGVNVAAGDVDGDGDEDIVTAAGPGGGPHVKIWKVIPPPRDYPATGCFPDLQEVGGFNAYNPGFAGGVSVAVGDVDSDGRAEIITGALAGGGPHVRVFDESGALEQEFMAYDPAFRGGVNVAAADVIGDRRGDIVTGAGPGGGPHVRVFTMFGRELSSFYAYAAEFAGGVFVAAGHPAPAPYASIVTGAGAGGGPHVRILDGRGNGPGGFYAYAVSAGVRVAVEQ